MTPSERGLSAFGGRFGRAIGATVLLVIVLGAATARAEENWATRRARELTEQGARQQAEGNTEVAAARFREAVEIDPTFGPGYLAWGALLEGGRDFAAAERVYSLGLEHVAGFADGYAARGGLRARERRFAEATADLRAAAELRPTDLRLLEQLADALIRDRALPAALAVARRIVRVATAAGDTASAERARLQTRALAKLLGDLDPVVAGADDRGDVRRALARSAR